MTISASPEELVEGWRKAEASNDGAALDSLLCEDFVGVGPRGWTRSKDQWVGRYTSGTLVNHSFTIEDLDVRRYGNAAVAVAAQQQNSDNGGRDASGRFRFTLLAVRRDTGWLLAGLHVSPLADA